MESFSRKSQSDNLSKGEKPQVSLVLHNDQVNSFDYVMESLCKICSHNDIQAEQCALLTHYTGKCEIKVGSKEELISYKDQLSSKNLLVTIE